ncbi:MAG: nucleoside hydrolase [Pseudomonadota bacterium]
MKIIIDTDPGVDDAMAIFYAHAAEEIELLGLTTAFGNVFVHQATRNALYLAEMLGKDIPVAQGAALPLVFDTHEPSKSVHGPEGFGDFTEIEVSGMPVDESAAAFLVRNAQEHQGKLAIVAIAPLTNIADAIRLDPEFTDNVAKIVIMGGAVDCPGNVTPFAEANIYHDPHAAAEVFASGCEIVLAGLDVTLQTLCVLDDFAQMAAMAPKTGGFLNDIGKYYLKFYHEIAGEEGCGLHDSTALIACTHPELFRMEKTGLSVALDGPELGNTVRAGPSETISVCTGVDGETVKDLFMQRILSNP